MSMTQIPTKTITIIISAYPIYNNTKVNWITI